MIKGTCPSERVDENPNSRAQAPLDFVKTRVGLDGKGKNEPSLNSTRSASCDSW